MVIGFDGSRAFVEGRTGTENYSYQLLKALASVDTENEYLIYLREKVSNVWEESEESNVKNKKPSMPSLRSTPSTLDNWPSNFKFKILNYPRFWTQVGLAIQTFIDPLDVLFVPSHTLPLIRKPGLKTVITVHDLGSEYLPGLHKLKQVLYLKLMTYYQLKTASKIIAVSEATKKDLVKKIGIKSEKIQVIYEGVDKTVFKRSLRFSASPAILKKIHKDIVNDIVKKYDLEREKYFLFVGTIQPRKNLERLIRAFALFARGPAAPVSRRMSSVASLPAGMRQEPSFASPLAQQKNNYQLPARIATQSVAGGPTTNYQLILVGQKGWKSDNIYKLPKELEIEDKIKFLPPQGGRVGRISDEDLAGLYNGAKALVYPSLFEGFGLPILEAFSCGCPVITSNISSMPEVAGGAAVLVDPEKEEDIAEAMVKIARNDAFRNSLIKKGYNRLEDFDWENTARETVKILKSV